METILIIILAVVFLAFVTMKIGDVFSPWTITSAVWLAILVLYQFQGDLLDPLSDQFLNCVAIWFPILCISSLVTYHVLPGTKGQVRSAEIPPMNRTIFTWLYVITIIITPVYVYQILKIAMMFNSADLLNNIRLLAVYGDQGYGFLQYSYVLSQVMVVVAFWQYPKIPLWQLISIVIVSLMSAFAIMEKGMMFFLFISVIFTLYEKRVIRMRSIVISVFSIVVIFFLINLARDYTEASESSDSMTFLDFFAIYILSPAAAFGKVQEDLIPQFGSHTFYSIYIFLVRWGGDFVVYDKWQEFVWVPLPTNVYTVFQPFYQDFGYRGVGMFALFYGVVSGWCYRLMRNGNGVAKCFYVYLCYALVLQFYQENFILNMVSLLQFLFFIVLIQQRNIAVDFVPREIEEEKEGGSNGSDGSDGNYGN